MFEQFIKERLHHGLTDGGFEKKVDQYEAIQARLCSLGFGEDQLDAILPQFSDKNKRPNSKRPNDYLKSGWRDLKNQFKKEPETPTSSTTTSKHSATRPAGAVPLPILPPANHQLKHVAVPEPSIPIRSEKHAPPKPPRPEVSSELKKSTEQNPKFPSAPHRSGSSPTPPSPAIFVTSPVVQSLNVPFSSSASAILPPSHSKAASNNNAQVVPALQPLNPSSNNTITIPTLSLSPHSPPVPSKAESRRAPQVFTDNPVVPTNPATRKVPHNTNAGRPLPTPPMPSPRGAARPLPQPPNQPAATRAQ
jgi:hypothetical protein